MNFWSFASGHPFAGCVLGIGACASVAVACHSFAENKTPVIGNISPSIHVCLGNKENLFAENNSTEIQQSGNENKKVEKDNT